MAFSKTPTMKALQTVRFGVSNHYSKTPNGKEIRSTLEELARYRAETDPGLEEAVDASALHPDENGSALHWTVRFFNEAKARMWTWHATPQDVVVMKGFKPPAIAEEEKAVRLAIDKKQGFKRLSDLILNDEPVAPESSKGGKERTE
ncbi:MAG: hypothetical protein Q9213_002711 [Squamulea squamosa]